jgi:hypothetical protein
MRWEWHVARIGGEEEEKNAYVILVGKVNGKEAIRKTTT